MAEYYATTWDATCRDCGRERSRLGYSGPTPYARNSTPLGRQIKNVFTCEHCGGPCDWIRKDEVIERVGDGAPPKLATFKSGSGRKPVLAPCPKCGVGVGARQLRRVACPHCGERFRGQVNGGEAGSPAERFPAG